MISLLLYLKFVQKCKWVFWSVYKSRKSLYSDDLCKIGKSGKLSFQFNFFMPICLQWDC